jgi:hypothetical protein
MLTRILITEDDMARLKALVVEEVLCQPEAAAA